MSPLSATVNPIKPTSHHIFADQVGGHAGQLFQEPNTGVLIKPTTQRECLFYETAHSTQSLLLPYLPRYLGHYSIDNQVYLCMENLLESYTCPCIMDVKLGTRLYDDDATPEKKQRMIHQATSTTSGETGLRICGLKIQHPQEAFTIVKGKEFGRSLNASTLDQGLITFFTSTHSCKSIHSSMLIRIRDQLRSIHEAVSHTECRLYSSSLLVIYEGNACFTSEEGKVDVRLIDFAHSHFCMKGEGMDMGALLGIERFIQVLTRLLEE